MMITEGGVVVIIIYSSIAHIHCANSYGILYLKGSTGSSSVFRSYFHFYATVLFCGLFYTHTHTHTHTTHFVLLL